MPSQLKKYFKTIEDVRQVPSPRIRVGTALADFVTYHAEAVPKSRVTSAPVLVSQYMPANFFGDWMLGSESLSSVGSRLGEQAFTAEQYSTSGFPASPSAISRSSWAYGLFDPANFPTHTNVGIWTYRDPALTPKSNAATVI